MKYENCWGPIQKGAHGIIFVFDPQAPGGEDLLMRYINLFPRAMNLQPKFCMLYVNHVNAGNNAQHVQLPKGLEQLDNVQGSAEDSSFIYSGFEKYLIKLLRLIGEQNKNDEDNILD